MVRQLSESMARIVNQISGSSPTSGKDAKKAMFKKEVVSK